MPRPECQGLTTFRERGRGDAPMRRTVLKRWMDLKSRWHDHAVVRLNPVANPGKFGP